MALLDFQTALGRLIRVPTGDDPLQGLDLSTDECARLAALVERAGFRFTVDVQRSWCAGRAARAAQLTLSLLPAEESRHLLEMWVRAGGGTASFFAAEAGVFFDFIAERLPDPSHALTLCRVEQAILRAREGARHFAAPHSSRLDTPGCMLRAGRYAALVRFHAAPDLLLATLLGEQPLPPLSPDALPMLFGPGLEGWFRVATDDGVALWARLVAPVTVTALVREGHRREAIEALVLAGGAEYVE